MDFFGPDILITQNGYDAVGFKQNALFFTSDLVDTVVWFSYMLVFFGDSSGGEDVPYVKMLVTPMFDSFSARGAAGGGWITSC